MTTSAQPERGIPDVNIERMIIETAPSQIRAVQGQIAALEASLLAKRALLRRILDTAVLYGVELCPVAPRELAVPALHGNAASPGRADGADIRGVA